MEKFAYQRQALVNAVKICILTVLTALAILLQIAVNNGVVDVNQYNETPIRISATPTAAVLNMVINGRDAHPFGWQGRINVPYPGGDIGNVVITPVDLCCDFDRCTNCDPVYGAYPTLVANPTFIPTSPPGLPTYVPTPVRDLPTRISTPVAQPPPTPDPSAAARPTGNVIVPENVTLTDERPAADITELDTGCFDFGNLDCGPFWQPTPIPTPLTGGGGGGELTPDFGIPRSIGGRIR